ncbi:MAG: hypothetical protein OHK003_27200 [Anaerolineales bacterium]
MNFSLRLAMPADASAVEACVHHAFGHYVERIGMKPAPMEMDYEYEICEHQVFVVEGDGRIVGSLVLGITEEGFLLDVIAVDPGWWGRVSGVSCSNMQKPKPSNMGSTAFIFSPTKR